MFLENDQSNPGRNVGAKNLSAGAEGEIKKNHDNDSILRCQRPTVPCFKAFSLHSPLLNTS